MKKKKALNIKREKRATRVRAKMTGTAQKPRLSIHKTNQYVYVQLIDDTAQKTIVSVSSFSKDKKKIDISVLGEKIAKLAIEKNIKLAVADRGMYKYHGEVKKIIESARANGLKI